MSITSPTQSEPSTATNSRCACPDCECTVTDAESAFVVGDVAYCSEACAEGHPHGEPCGHDGCHCGESARKD